MDRVGVLDERLNDVDDVERVRRTPSLQLVGSSERRSIDLNALSAAGVNVTGRLAHANDTHAQFSGALANMLRSADLKMNRLLDQIDEFASSTGLADEIAEGTEILLGRGWSAGSVLNDALVEAMRIVGIDFRDGILFVPEVLLSANAMKAGMAILRPLLAETGAESVGTIVIGTVKGDIHDIGKNLVSMMMEGAGFEVVDLGINNPVENYLDALEKESPDILGMSALLTTTMPYMKVVIDTMVEKGIRDDTIVLVGGAPLNAEFGKAIGADAYCRDAAVAEETAKEFVARTPHQHADG